MIYLDPAGLPVKIKKNKKIRKEVVILPIYFQNQTYILLLFWSIFNGSVKKLYPLIHVICFHKLRKKFIVNWILHVHL